MVVKSRLKHRLYRRIYRRTKLSDGVLLAADFGYEFSVGADTVTVHGGELRGDTVDNTPLFLEAAVRLTAVHSFGEWSVTTEPTCVDEGVETCGCAGCTATMTRPVSATGIHTYGETGEWRYTCTVRRQVDEELKAAAEGDDQAAADRAAADSVIAKIDAIGEVDYTEECRARIDEARAAYNDLTQTQKDLVGNYCVLEAAEIRYDELKAAAETPTDPAGPTGPTDPGSPSGGDGKCKWCGKDHSVNFWQRIVGFCHTIFYFFARLFGIRKA